jgi:hypothetical protein
LPVLFDHLSCSNLPMKFSQANWPWGALCVIMVWVGTWEQMNLK